MKLLREAAHRAAGPGAFRSLACWLLAIVAALLPTASYAAGGENIVLNFTASEKIYLYISLAFGLLALVVAVLLRNKVLAVSPGSEKMQSVGLAIREGALAYLRRQVKTMLIFVALLAIGLFLLDNAKYGATIGILTAVCFVAGVLASYIAGYAGMLMAVAGNMRTANSALTSYKKSLETAFQSGAVAGLVTVGMGLIGATLILLFAGADAMKLLVGFGFGGSLAALFMRVGGGIFTKAADVGADLVGKVEAGIPEDDPRNPATIADNVGDNVGDCAGMAADVFESYEVTLVAAIILGAATAAIFPTEIWTRLVLFALMARGVGIIASVIGIYSVKGNDNVDTDPLKAIRKGFYVAAAIALAFTFGLAYWMMGGTGKPIQTTRLTSVEQLREKQDDQIRDIRDSIARERKVPVYQVTEREVRESAAFRALSLREEEAPQAIQQALNRPADAPVARALEGFTEIDFVRGGNPALDFTTIKPEMAPRTGEPDFETMIVSVRDAYREDAQMVVATVTQTIPGTPPPTQRGETPPPAPTQTRTLVLGPATKPMLDEFLKSQGAQLKLDKTFPVKLYANTAGELAYGVEGSIPNFRELQPLPGSSGLVPQFFRQPAAEVRSEAKRFQDEAKAAQEAQRANPNVPPAQPEPPKLAQPETIKVAMVEHTVVPWYLFAIAIAFGLFMAFAIEILTDYYVSTHKRPVQEIAGVSTAGPAPMIISGFALAAESSVFMVFSIVIALLFPLFLFPPEIFGGYLLSFYGIALVGLGLLATTGYVLAMDTFGPISDNAQGVYEMSGEAHDNEYGSKAVQRLDAAGNTTKALTKGFAIATAVVAAVALFHTYLESARLGAMGLRLDLPEIFLGLLIGGAAPYLFSAFSINAVGRAAFELINNVRSQFRNDPGIMAGTSKPDYGACVAIVTRAAQKELLSPGILAIALPIAVGFGFAIGGTPTEINGQFYNLQGAQALGGFLAGIIVSGQLMAVLLANAGGMWDNAKKVIEDGMYGGKGSEAHKAAVVCDTVGDPFKDTAGPALNPLIKVMNLVSLLLAPTIIMPLSNTALIIITAIALAALVFAIFQSKKGSMSSGLQAVGAIEGSPAPTLDAPAAETTPAPAKKRITVEDEPEA